MSTIRITGGQHRGRKLSVPVITGLRPSTDRARVTLFNWLMPYVQGASALDLFAGSGILSFEALSRGAKSVCLIDSSVKACRHINHWAGNLNYSRTQVQIMCKDVISWLQTEEHVLCCDLIFVDPPFQQFELVKQTLDCVIDKKLLNTYGFLYVEAPRLLSEEELVAWSVHRQKRFGAVFSYLLKKS